MTHMTSSNAEALFDRLHLSELGVETGATSSLGRYEDPMSIRLPDSQPWLPTTIPAQTSTRPAIFSSVTDSCRNQAEPSITSTNARLTNGYACESSSLVSAAIQAIDETRAAARAEIIQGFRRSRARNRILSPGSAGKAPAAATCHLMTSWPYVVSRIVRNT